MAEAVQPANPAIPSVRSEESIALGMRERCVVATAGPAGLTPGGAFEQPQSDSRDETVVTHALNVATVLGRSPAPAD